MSEKIRVGIIGTSPYAEKIHLPAFASHPRAELAAICGRTQSRTAAVAAKYKIPESYADYRKMIAHANFDAVAIIAPDDLHHPMTMAALDAGLHVLCEKPLALNVGQAAEMTEKAAQLGVKNMIFFTCRWLPYFRYLKQLIQEDFIGRCYQCLICFQMGYGRSGEYVWRLDAERANGALGDLGSHMIDFAQWCIGEITTVSAQLTTFVKRHDAGGSPLKQPANDSAILTLEFANGARGMIHVSAVTPIGDRGRFHHISFHGDKGSLEANITRSGGQIYGVRSAEEAFKPLSVPDHIFGASDRANPYGVFITESAGARKFIDAIIADRSLEPDFHCGLSVQRVIDAAIASHSSGRKMVL
ncbi:Gfo/Idh/MocA family oxidoreductase [candidate division KSB1 bacterium]|nr:Gfo/Idh/MocA family oxidoreductase [candidate division KSB1 bacterium]